MHKIIHSSFQLDLSNYNIAIVHENHWFSDKFFTKYSFPFDIYITDELLEALGDFLDDNNQLLKTLFNVKYVLGDLLEDAILEVENQNGRRLSTTIRYGFDELPNFDKKLNELSLEQTAITDIIAHAKTIINQTWPAVNYNYPQIHTEKYDTTSATWATFLKIINNYDGTNFLANTASPIDNQNIIQPAVYLLHILTKGFLDAGYILKGDITTDTMVKKLCLFADLDYFSFDASPIIGLVEKADYTALSGSIATYDTSVALNSANQKFRITGTVTLYSKYDITTYTWLTSSSTITYKGTTIFSGSSDNSSSKKFIIDQEFTTDGATTATQILKLNTIQEYWRIIDPLFDLEISRINDTGANEVHIPVEVDLTKVVPDITFGSLVAIVKNYLNIDLNIQGTDIFMNFIENSINYNDATDLSNYETKKERLFEANKSFLLKFKDTTDAPTPYLPVFHNAQITELSDKNSDDNTNIIEINALPLPNKTVGTINTSFAFEQGGKSAIYFLLYNGIEANGLNLTQDPAELMLSNIHSNYYKKWFDFRVNAKTYKWKFKMFEEDLKAIIDNFKIFAYGQYHIIKTLDKTQIAEDLFEVDVETENLK